MKNLTALFVALGVGLMALAAVPASAAGTGTEVRVALLDMSAMMGRGGGWGVMGGGGAPGAGPNQDGQGWGMMGQRRGGYGFGHGWGMMGGGPGQGGSGWGTMGMGRMTIRTDHATVKAGDVHFTVTNWSQAIVHEMIVVAVDNPDAPLPYDYDTGRVPEDQIKTLGEVSDLSPNAVGDLDVNLAPGSYLLICNVAGHYAAGMVTPLTVTP
ncbi:putative copper-binding protein [Hartmannibacter diazotrophicus]|uniref:Putative copper-binding protein n=1 Tax=Hartmannibacter diazotrophicus TaxID=1482074 RepID=A0A2C9D5H6_9HYPH|nr:hypothetical protein [Hartmannibacter diazotrophicus]SON55001.1 putative copper-binding protein [Hartmannibacter diazotrophicus]